MEESALDNILDSVLRRAALTDALNKIDIDYDKYVLAMDTPGSTDRNGYIDAIRRENIEYFVQKIKAADTSDNLSIPVQFVTKHELQLNCLHFYHLLSFRGG